MSIYHPLLPKFISWRHVLCTGSLADLERAIMLGQNVNELLDYPRDNERAISLLAGWATQYQTEAISKIKLLYQHKADVSATNYRGLKASRMCTVKPVRQLLLSLEKQENDTV